MQYRNYRSYGGGNSWLGLIIGILILVGIYFIFKSIFALLKYAFPVLIIATLIINYKVVLEYFQNIGKLVQRSPLLGIGAALLTLVFYPFVTLFLFTKSISGKSKPSSVENPYSPYGSVQNPTQHSNGNEEYVDFEEIEIQDPPLPKRAPEAATHKNKTETKTNDTYNSYDEIFD